MSVARGRRRRLPSEEETQLQLGLSWLLQLRWGAVAGQLAALLLARAVLCLDLPYAALLALVAFTAVTNAALTWVGTPAAATWPLPAALAVDVVVLTIMLAASGGASNPFTVFFLLHVALAALLLEARLAWSVVALTVVAFAALFVPSQLLALRERDPTSIRVFGIWIAYALAAGFVAYFVGRVSRAIRERDRRLTEVSNLAAQNERLATLSSFSANAAHELGSPLATIGLAAKELAIGLRRGAPAEALTADAALVGSEVSRCREILAGLSARAGESVGEMPIRTTPARVVDELVRQTPRALVDHLRVVYVDEASRTASVVVPSKTLAQMLHNLVRNAFDAQEDANVDEPVVLRIDAGERLCFHVLDRGLGIPPQIRDKLGEPFVTTKGDRGGLGLGVYLARAYAERTGGYLRCRARPEGGADVELCLARDALRGRA